MLQNNIELNLKTKQIENGTMQTEVVDKARVSFAYMNRIAKRREQLVGKTFLDYDVELTYKKRQPTEAAAN